MNTGQIGDMNFGTQQGWQCPCCGRVYAPSVVMCMYCGGNQQPSPHIPPQPWAGTPDWRETATYKTTGEDNDYTLWNRSYQNMTWSFDQTPQPTVKYTAADMDDIAMYWKDKT